MILFQKILLIVINNFLVSDFQKHFCDWYLSVVEKTKLQRSIDF
jgi:hypothetical protein